MSVATDRAAAESALQDPRVWAFLQVVVRPPESGAGPAGYGLFYGDTVPSITDFSHHPGMRIVNGANHSAAGAYQFLIDTWNWLAPQVGVTDFTAHSQDLVAVQMLKVLGALPLIQRNDIAGAIAAANGTNGWASLPGGSQSRGRTLDSALSAYAQAVGGTVPAPASNLPAGLPPAATSLIDPNTLAALAIAFVVLMMARNYWGDE